MQWLGTRSSPTLTVGVTVAVTLITSLGAAMTPPATVGTVTTAGFRLEVREDCTAVLIDGATAARGSAVPFLELYNKVADGRQENLSPCIAAAVVPTATLNSERRSKSAQNGHAEMDHQGAGGNENRTVFRVTAAFGYGTLDISVEPSVLATSAAVFTVVAVEEWEVDLRIVAFGEWWSGHLDNATESPIIMGKLQGPRSLSGLVGGGSPSRRPTSGFATLSRRGYYKYLLDAEVDDAVGFLFGPTETIDSNWIALGRERGAEQPRPHRFASWYWASVKESNAEAFAARANALGAELVFLMGVLEPTHWNVDPTSFPSGVGKTVQSLRDHGLLVGLHTLPYAPTACQGQCARDAFVQEGLAPTYRSGSWRNGVPIVKTSDLGFWWGHENGGDIAQNGNPIPSWYGFECPQLVAGYPCVRWGSNMSLHNTTWSALGDYRQGGSIGFDGVRSFAAVAQSSQLDSIVGDGLTDAAGLTLGLTAHPAPASGSMPNMTLASLAGSFALSLHPDRTSATPEGTVTRWIPRWTVQLKDGTAITAQAGTASVVADQGNVIKATYNSTSRRAHLFVNNTIVAASEGRSSWPASPTDGALLATVPSRPPIFIGAESPSVAAGFQGSLEEIFLKNVSTENQVAYIYTDNVRPDPEERVYVFDLNRASGRAYFSSLMSRALNADGASFDTTQWDGFEVSLVMAGSDFPRSRATPRSGLYRGSPAPDWYHSGWPLYWGQGVLEGMEDVMAQTNNNTAVECSFMAPGLGPWRPDMVPYVDERDTLGLVGLGLEWHPKMMFRTEISGVPVNPYHTPLSWVQNATELEYWLGGLVTAGIAPQLSEFGGVVTAWTDVAHRFLSAYRDFGHLVEGGITTLRYDTACCHIQGECEWVACNDTIASQLVGGRIGGPVAGVYVGSSSALTAPILVPSRFAPDNTTVLIFLSWVTSDSVITVGSPTSTSLRVIATSPTPGRNITLVGGFLSGLPPGGTIDATEVDSDGTVTRHWSISGPGPLSLSFLSGVFRELRLIRRASTSASEL